MPLITARRLVIHQHARQDSAVTGATWSASGQAVRIGLIDRYVEQDVRMPSTAVAPHLSLMLLLEGSGHFRMGNNSRSCEFLPGHCFLSCGFEPFDGEDFIPAHARYRAVLLHYPLAWRSVMGTLAPLAPAHCEVHAHAYAKAWLARMPMDPWLAQFARALAERGLPGESLALLSLESQALQALHGVASKLLNLTVAAPQAAAGEPDEAGESREADDRIVRLNGRDRRRLLAARRHIDSHLAAPLRVADIARAAGMSDTALKQGFRGAFGTSVYAYVLQARCRHAEKLLRETPCSIDEVALRCGFANASHLARQFRRHAGTTPLQYRHQQV